MARLKKSKKGDGVKQTGKFVVNIKGCLENGKYDDSVTKFISKKDAKKVYELLESYD